MVTYKDIAAKCDVTTATVSYVLNGKGSVSLAVRQKILRAAEELGYEVRAGVKKTNRIIRLYCADIETLPNHMFFNELLAGIFSVTTQNDCDVIVTPVPRTGDGKIAYSPQMLGDGILVINPRNNPAFLEEIKRSQVPCLIIGRPGDGDDELCYVDVDNVAVGYQMTKYMLEHGHRAPLFVNGPQEYTISQDRLNGYRMALKDFGAAYQPEMVLHGNFIVEDTRRAVLDYLRCHPAPSGIIANSDELTIGVLEALKEMKLQVPQNCSLICGGEGVLVRMYPAPITGVDLHHMETGRRAAKMLLSLMDKTLIQVTQYLVSFEMNERGSVLRKKP